MTETAEEIVLRLCHSLVPVSTDTTPRLNKLPQIRAVLFDIYGTLLVSGAGDMTLQTGTSSEDAFQTALLEQGCSPAVTETLSVSQLQTTIAAHHALSREKGIEFPEVDIISVWREMLAVSSCIDADTNSATPGSTSTLAESIDLERLALSYECRVNPVWPMPDLVETLARIDARELPMGIVSNAQAMTPGLFPALTGRTLPELGFDARLCFFSYRYGESKPGLQMFTAAAAALAERGIQTDQTVYIGNDMLKDIWSAAQVGFRTVLFAGDKRSLRLRADNQRVSKIEPDAIVTDLHSILECILD